MSEVSYRTLGEAVRRLREALERLEQHPQDEFTVPLRDSVLLSFLFT